MVQYRLGTELTRLPKGGAKAGEADITIMTLAEFQNSKEPYAYRKILIHSMETIHYCKAESLGSCTLGTFQMPDKKNLLGQKISFGFYLTKEELILLDEGHALDDVVVQMKDSTYGNVITVTGFLTLLLDNLIWDDVLFLQEYERKMSDVEEALLDHLPKDFYQTVIQCRKELLALHTYYEQLISMGEELETNDNLLFSTAECDAFRIFSNRVSRLHDHVEMLREYVLQIREMYQSQIDISQNQIMSWLTVVTTIFLPLSILVGWYGMNFVNMRELQWKYGYLAMIVVSILIVIIQIGFFRKKKFL